MACVPLHSFRRSLVRSAIGVRLGQRNPGCPNRSQTHRSGRPLPPHHGDLLERTRPVLLAHDLAWRNALGTETHLGRAETLHRPRRTPKEPPSSSKPLPDLELPEAAVWVVSRAPQHRPAAAHRLAADPAQQASRHLQVGRRWWEMRGWLEVESPYRVVRATRQSPTSSRHTRQNPPPTERPRLRIQDKRWSERGGSR